MCMYADSFIKITKQRLKNNKNDVCVIDVPFTFKLNGISRNHV